MSANYFSIHKNRTYISSALTIMHPKVVGTCANVLTMEKAYFPSLREVPKYYWRKEHTIVGHVTHHSVSHIAMCQYLCIPSVCYGRSIPTRCLFHLQSSFGLSFLPEFVYVLCSFMLALDKIRLGCWSHGSPATRCQSMPVHDYEGSSTWSIHYGRWKTLFSMYRRHHTRIRARGMHEQEGIPHI